MNELVIVNKEDRAGYQTAGHHRAVAVWRDSGQTRLGTVGYLCVLAYLQAGPATADEVVAAFNLGKPQWTHENLKRMGKLGMIHQAGAVKVAKTGPEPVLWAFGPGPIHKKMLPARGVHVGIISLRSMINALETPRGLKALAAECGSNFKTAGQFLQAGRRLRMLHISDWDMPSLPQGGGEPVAQYLWGAGTDARRPRPIGPQEGAKRCRKSRAAKELTMQIVHAIAGMSRNVLEVA